MVNHVSDCVYKLSYQPNCTRLKISLLPIVKFYIVEIRMFALFCSSDLDRMTFIHELHLYSLKMYPDIEHELYY